ncbi:hypothetical protein ElyMa_003099900, partial [Elysia marginata]
HFLYVIVVFEHHISWAAEVNKINLLKAKISEVFSAATVLKVASSVQAVNTWDGTVRGWRMWVTEVSGRLDSQAVGNMF